MEKPVCEGKWHLLFSIYRFFATNMILATTFKVSWKNRVFEDGGFGRNDDVILITYDELRDRPLFFWRRE